MSAFSLPAALSIAPRSSAAASRAWFGNSETARNNLIMLQNKIGRAFLVLVSLLGLAALIIAGLNYGWWSRRTQMIAPAKFDLALPLTRGPFKIKIYSPRKTL